MMKYVVGVDIMKVLKCEGGWICEGKFRGSFVQGFGKTIAEAITSAIASVLN